MRIRSLPASNKFERQDLNRTIRLTREHPQLGSTGNVYVSYGDGPVLLWSLISIQTISIGAVPQCDCPDYRKGNVPWQAHLVCIVSINISLDPPQEGHDWTALHLLMIADVQSEGPQGVGTGILHLVPEGSHCA